MKNVFKTLIVSFFVTIFLVFAATGVLFWRLHHAPINTDRLAPYLSKNIEGLSFGGSSFFWKKFYKSPKVFLKNVHYTIENIKLSAENAEITFSLWKVLLGTYEVEKLKIFTPKGEIYLDTSSEDMSKKTLSEKLESLFQNQKQSDFSLRTIEISEGDVLLKTKKNALDLKDINLVYKNKDGEIFIESSGKINENSFALSLNYIKGKKLSVGFKSEKIDLGPILEVGNIKSSTFKTPIPPLKIDLGTNILFNRTEIHGTIEVSVTPYILVKNQEYKTSAHIAVSGQLKDKILEFDLHAAADPFETKLLPQLWPKELAPTPRAWVITNIIGGIVDQADINMQGSIPMDTKELKISSLGGTVIIRDADVDYITGMSRVQNAKVIGTYDQKDFHIDVKRGNIHHLKITDGHIVLKNMDLADQDGDVSLKIEGPLREALELIDSPPLEYCKSMNIDPKTTSGNAQIDLNLKFPLETTLTTKDIKAQVNAALKKVRLLVTLKDLQFRIENGTLALKLDNKSMHIKGPILLDGSPVALKWHELFNTKKPYKTKYEIAGDIRADQLKPFLPKFLENSFENTVGLDLAYQELEKEKGQMTIALNLEKTKLRIPQLDWQKSLGEKGYLHLSCTFKKGALTSISSLIAKMPALLIRGNLTFKNGNLSSFEFPTFNWNDNILEIKRGHDKNNILNLDIHSPRLNISGVLKEYLEADSEEDSLPEFTLKAKIKELILSPDLTLKDLNTQLSRKNKAWDFVDLLATYNASDIIEITFKPDHQEKKFHFRATNISPFLKAFDIVKDVKGGEVLIKGVESLKTPNSPVIGTLKIAEINIIEAPLLARLLSLASFSGITDFLGGKGLKFNEGYADFEKNQGMIIINKAGMSSTSLGITAKGILNTAKKEINLEGVIVPAYIFNQLLSYIPIIGQILSGGDAEKGIFSMSYGIKGPTKDPKVSVNPLSVLAPGLLKNMFDAGKPASITQAQKELKETENTKTASMA